MSDSVGARERILAAMDHEERDRVPVFDVVNNPAIYRELLGSENEWSEGGPAVALARALGLDAVMVPCGCYTGLIKKENDWIAADIFRDRFGAEHDGLQRHAGEGRMHTGRPFAAAQVEADALQVFGGYGFMKEYPAEKMMRDAKILQIYEGTNQIQRDVIGAALIKEYASKAR